MSVPTVKRLENASVGAGDASRKAVVDALASAGIVFLDGRREEPAFALGIALREG